MPSLADYLNHTPKDPRVAFWSQRARWPIDSKDHIFAAQAVLALGRHRFGDAWSDDCPATELSYLLPELTLWTPIEEVRRGVELIAREQRGILGGLARIGSELANRQARGTCFPTDAEWQEAIALSKVDKEKKWQHFRPYLVVVQELSNACHTGKLKTAVRHHAGGELLVQDWQFWNFEFNQLRFDTCKVALGDPFNTSPVQADYWLFIERESFASLISDPAAPPTAVASEEAIAQEQRSRRRAPGRRPEYDWEELAIEFGERWEAGEFTDDMSTSDIANRLLDSLAVKGKKLPDHKTISDKVSRWRSVRSNSGQ